MIVISKKYCSEVNRKLNEILKKYEITPKTFKWNKFNSKKKVNALKEFLEYLFRLMSRDIVHITTIIWDIHDSRHEILRRDDKKNLSFMYYKLIKNFAEDKLKNGDTLTIYPDQNNSIDWNLIEEILPTVCLTKVFIKESNTSENALIQIADIFAGLARTSYEDYKNYEKWLNRSQTSLFPDEELNQIDISVKDEHRFIIYQFLDTHCKRKSWSVSLKSNKGFYTYEKRKPLNFWFYKPQHEEDTAPLKNK